MRSYELMRRVTAGSLTIRLWIDASDGPCELCDELADEVAMCAATLANEDDDPLTLAEKIVNTLRVKAAEVVDATGDGGIVRQQQEEV